MRWSWKIKSDLNADGYNDWLQMAEIAVSCGPEAGRWKRFLDGAARAERLRAHLVEINEIYRAENGIKAIWSELNAS